MIDNDSFEENIPPTEVNLSMGISGIYYFEGTTVVILRRKKELQAIHTIVFIRNKMVIWIDVHVFAIPPAYLSFLYCLMIPITTY